MELPPSSLETKEDKKDDEPIAVNKLPDEVPNLRFNFTYGSEVAALRAGGNTCNPPDFLTKVSFADLTSATTNSDTSPSPTIRLSVDHETEGGRWILLGTRTWNSKKISKPEVSQLPLSPLQSNSASLPVRYLGKALGFNLKELVQLRESFDGVRLFDCSLADRDNVTHVQVTDSKDIGKISSYLMDAPETLISKPDLLTNLRSAEHLPGHRKAPHSSCLWTGCSLPCRAHRRCVNTWYRLPQSNVRLTCLWIRFKSGVLESTDPGDPSFWKGGGDDLALAQKRRSGSSKRRKEEKNDQAKEQEEKGGERTLEVMRQETFDEEDVLQMVRPDQAHIELQEFVVQQDIREADKEGVGLDADHNLICFHCDGTGERWVAVKNAYGEEAGERERVRMTSRDNAEYQRSLSRTITGMSSTSRSWEGGSGEGNIGEVLGGGRSHTFESDCTALSYDSDEGEKELDAQQINIHTMPMTTDSSNQVSLVLRSNSEKEYENDQSSLVVPATLDKCWVCRGTGVSSSAMLEIGENMTSGGEHKEEKDEGEEEEGDDDLCLICWSEPVKYGVSTSCTHCFCEECIQSHLKTIQMTGSFPGFCPLCESSAPEGEEPRFGRIDGRAMTFLQRKNVIDKEFQFLFMRKQNEGSTDSFFACPAACGNYLVDVDPTYVLRDGETCVRTERCPCGTGVCVQCHQLIEEANFLTHVCPTAKESRLEDEKSMKLMQKLGKKCPNCKMFIIKNEGCDYMMCGDKAHGDLTKAIRAGGCGQAFMWSSLVKITDACTNFEGKRDRCIAPIKYAKEIACKKREWGIVMSDKEMEMADEYEREVGGASKDRDLETQKKLKVMGPKAVMNACLTSNTYSLIDNIVRIRKQRHRLCTNKKYWVKTGCCVGGELELIQSLFWWPPFFVVWMLGFIFVWCISCMFPRRIFACCYRAGAPGGRCEGKTVLLCGWCRVHRVESMSLSKSMLCLMILCLYMYLLANFDGWYIFIIMLTFPFVYFSWLLHLSFNNINTYNTPLTLSSAKGDVDLVKLLLRHQARPDYRGSSSITPVFAAAIHGRSGVIDVLLEHSPNISGSVYPAGCCGLRNMQRCCCTRTRDGAWTNYERQCNKKWICYQLHYTFWIVLPLLFALNWDHFFQRIYPPTIEPFHPFPFSPPLNGTYFADRSSVSLFEHKELVDILLSNRIGHQHVFATHASSWPSRQALRFDKVHSFSSEMERARQEKIQEINLIREEYGYSNGISKEDLLPRRYMSINKTTRTCVSTGRVHDCSRAECRGNIIACPEETGALEASSFDCDCACPLDNLRPPTLQGLCGTFHGELSCRSGACEHGSGILRDSELPLGGWCFASTLDRIEHEQKYFGRCPSSYKKIPSSIVKTREECAIQCDGEGGTHFSFLETSSECQTFFGCPYTLSVKEGWRTSVRPRSHVVSGTTTCAAGIDVCPVDEERRSRLWRSGGRGGCMWPWFSEGTPVEATVDLAVDELRRLNLGQHLRTSQVRSIVESFQRRDDAVRLLGWLDNEENEEMVEEMDDESYGRLCFQACGMFDGQEADPGSSWVGGTTATGCEYVPSPSRACWLRRSPLKFTSNKVGGTEASLFQRLSLELLKVDHTPQNQWKWEGLAKFIERTSVASDQRYPQYTQQEVDDKVQFNGEEGYCWTFHSPSLLPNATEISDVVTSHALSDRGNNTVIPYTTVRFDVREDAMFQMHVLLPKWRTTDSSKPVVAKTVEEWKGNGKEYVCSSFTVEKTQCSTATSNVISATYGCQEKVPAEVAGYCICRQKERNQNMMVSFDCGHVPFQCDDVCQSNEEMSAFEIKCDPHYCDKTLWEWGGSRSGSSSMWGSWIGTVEHGIFRLRVGNSLVRVDQDIKRNDLAVIDVVMASHLDMFDGKIHSLRWDIRMGSREIALYIDGVLLGEATWSDQVKYFKWGDHWSGLSDRDDPAFAHEILFEKEVVYSRDPDDLCKCTGKGNEIECTKSGKRHCTSYQDCKGGEKLVEFGLWSVICKSKDTLKKRYYGGGDPKWYNNVRSSDQEIIYYKPYGGAEWRHSDRQWVYSLLRPEVYPWKFCSMEGEICRCPSQVVRYGYGFQYFAASAGGVFVEGSSLAAAFDPSSKGTIPRAVSSSTFTCGNDFFGGDPYPNKSKRCECYRGGAAEEYGDPTRGRVVRQHLPPRETMTSPWRSNLTFRIIVYDGAPHEVTSISHTSWCNSKSMVLQRVPSCPATCYEPATGIVHLKNNALVNLRTHPTEGCKICPDAKFPECLTEKEKEEKKKKKPCNATRGAPKAVQFHVVDTDDRACVLEYFGARVAEDGRRECGWVPLSSPMQVELNDNTSVVDRVEENLENKVENKVEVTSMPKFSKRGQSYDNDEKMFGMDGGVGACTSLTTMVLHKPLSGFRNVTWSTACESAGVGSTVTSYDECFVGSKYFNSFREYPTFVGGKLDASKKEPLSVSTGKGFVHVNDIDSEQQYQSYGRCSNSDKWIPPLLNTDGSGVHNSIKKCFGDTSPSQFWPNDRKQEGCTNMVSDDPTSNPDNKARLCTPDMCKPYTGTPFLPLQCSTQPHVLDSFKTEEVEEEDSYMSHRPALKGCVLEEWGTERPLSANGGKVSSSEEPSSIYFVNDYQSHRRMDPNVKVMCRHDSDSLSMGFCMHLKKIEFKSVESFRDVSKIEFQWSPPVDATATDTTAATAATNNILSRVRFHVYYGDTRIHTLSETNRMKRKVTVTVPTELSADSKSKTISFIGEWTNDRSDWEEQARATKVDTYWSECSSKSNNLLLLLPTTCLSERKAFQDATTRDGNSMEIGKDHFAVCINMESGAKRIRGFTKNGAARTNDIKYTLGCECEKLQLPWCARKELGYDHSITKVKVIHKKRRVKANVITLKEKRSVSSLPQWMLLGKEGVVFASTRNVTKGDDSNVFASSHQNPKYDFCDGMPAVNMSIMSVSVVVEG